MRRYSRQAASLGLTQADELVRQTSILYDGYDRGLVAEAIAAAGTPAQADTLTGYDADGRVSLTRDPAGAVMTSAYDRAGRPTCGSRKPDSLNERTRSDGRGMGRIGHWRIAVGDIATKNVKKVSVSDRSRAAAPGRRRRWGLKR